MAAVAKKKRYNRRKRIIIAYTLRTVVLLVFAGLISLMVCGCIFIYNLFHPGYTGSNAYAAESSMEAYGNGTTEGMDYLNRQTMAGNIKIILDAGHGGEDCGTYSGDVWEKDINLAVVLHMKELLENAGVEVVLTRDADESLSLNDRTVIANGQDADMFVSIHCNYYEDDSSIKGLECYYYEDSKTGQAYAEGIINSLKQDGSITVRNAKEDTFYVLKNTKVTAVLVELGYLSNSKECQKLASESYQATLASELVESILEIIG